MSFPNFTLRKPEDDIERRVISDISEFGWHVVHVLADEVGPQYSFTVGLYYTFQHPEFIMMGLNPATTHQIFTTAVAEISKGFVFKTDTFSDRLLESCSCQFTSVKPENYREYLGCANWFYRGLKSPYPTLQIIWPDQWGKFPDDAGFDPMLKQVQLEL
jgi:hypothetical protein